MNIMTFEEMFNSQKMLGEVAKERDKFADIVDAVGIDPMLLKSGSDETDGKPNSKLPWKLPEESIPFVKGLLEDYTSKDFKAMRKADFYAVSLETVERLIDGFCKMLRSLGYGEQIVDEQRKAMNGRMHYSVRSSRKEVDSVISDLTETLDEFEGEPFGLRKDEFPFFYDFVRERIEETLSYIREVHSNYVDIRHDELTDQAQEEASQLDEVETL